MGPSTPCRTERLGVEYRFLVFGPLLALCAAMALQPEQAPAEPSATLVWQAPSGCPSEAEVRQRLAVLVGSSHVTVGEITAEAQVFEPADGEGRDAWFATVVIQSASGERVREIEASTCDALAQATAVLVSVALDPLGRLPEPEEPEQPAPLPEEPEPARPLPEFEPTRTPRPISSDRSLLYGVFGIRAGVGTGPLPQASATLGGRLGLRYRALRVDLGAQYWFAQETLIRSSGFGGTFSLWVVDARLCGVPSWRTLEFPLCFGTQLGGLSSRGLGVAAPRRDMALWAALTAGAGFIVRPIERLGIGVEAALAVPLARPRFVIDDFGEVHRPGAIAFEAIAVVEARLPRARRVR